LTGSIFAQAAADDRAMAFSIQPLASFLGPNVKFAFKISDRIALTVPFSAGYRFAVKILDERLEQLPEQLQNLIKRLESPNRFLATVGFGAKFFLSDTAFKSGWFVEPDVTVSYAYQIAAGTSSLALTPEVTFGYGWVWNNGFLFNFALGAGVNFNLFGEKVYPFRISPTSELAIGYAW